jgi:hypothetical protein
MDRRRHASDEVVPTGGYSSMPNWRDSLTSVLCVAACCSVLFLAACSSITKDAIHATAFPGFDATGLNAAQASRLKQAEVDFNRVRSKREPLYAQFEQSLRDGGTRLYRGQGYLLGALNRINSRNGAVGRIVGPAILLEREITGRAPVQYEETRFVSVR